MALTDASPTEQADPAASSSPSGMGDLYPYATDHRLVVATIDGGDRQLVHLDWSNGRRQTVHALWLRDQCACNRCRHPASLERILDQKSYGLDIFPALVSIDGGQRLFVAWAEGVEGNAPSAIENESIRI